MQYFEGEREKLSGQKFQELNKKETNWRHINNKKGGGGERIKGGG